ncbi:MAG TPA: DUF2804 family protein, partial [Solirubrobacteraceae bacterium]|nr:DUF2804 family protein [Solirubrobacteraceae bacterium]
MPSRDRLRPLKAWRYVGVYGPEVMLCAATVRIGPARQSFWAVWDRGSKRLHDRTALGSVGVRLAVGRLQIDNDDVRVDIELDEEAGIETVCPTGASYAWTRKQGGIGARGEVALGAHVHRLDARAVIDDTAGYYERHTRWHWSAGVGTATDGRSIAWNLVAGVNDPTVGSERTVWVDGEPREPAPVEFDAGLTSIRFGDGRTLGFRPEAMRAR